MFSGQNSRCLYNNIGDAWNDFNWLTDLIKSTFELSDNVLLGNILCIKQSLKVSRV